MAQEDTLLYFDFLRGRPEPTRMLYSLADEPLKNEVVSSEGWAAIKKDQPVGQIPVLTTKEGEVLCQSNVMARYAAKKFGFFGSGLWEETLHDLVVEVTMEAVKPVADKIYAWKILKRCSEPEDSDAVIEEVKKNMMPKLNYIQSIADKQGKKYIVGDTIGLADVWLYCNLEFCKLAFPDIMEITPWIKKFTANVISDERIKKHVESREKTKFDI